MLSVVIPANDISSNIFLSKTLQALQNMKNVEVICVGNEEAYSRAERLNIGFHRAAGKIILLNHPRSFVDLEGIKYLVEMSLTSGGPSVWGGFTHKFDKSHWILKFTSWYSNKIRARFNGVLYLDHCIFFHRELWKKDIPPVEIFEDTLLSYHFLQHSRPKILPFISQTSAVRFSKNGVWRQSLMNQILKLGFFLKVPHATMNRIYEKGLGLNNSVK